jgi:spore coat polysaccharide biosynthesis predicted glycosyltransferase SpsG/CMP-N-acetylneuraminic acid synthetase
MNNILLIIPAIKKNAVIPDQLIKKLDGITLIQRAINTAKKITNKILIITDSEEISLISNRNNIEFYFDNNLTLSSINIIDTTKSIIRKYKEQNIILYRANTPLVSSTILLEAYDTFLKQDDCILTSVKNLDRQLLKYENDTLSNSKNRYFKELKAFYIFKNSTNSGKLKPFVVDDEYSIEIETYQDWWICEKLLQQKIIVFNVIGSQNLGMGHIFHSLALAHEITDHKIIFVCDEKYEIAVEKIALMDYEVISTENVTTTILELNPDLVINDVLNTDLEYIKSLKNNNIKVVNFEDLGDGTKKADLVINELYEEPQLKGDNFLWGYKYLALRDEFEDATVHKFEDTVSSVLITFGGTDQNNLTLITLKSIINFAKDNGIKIYIVCGSRYLFKKELKGYLLSHTYKNIELTFAVGVMSKIMEKTQIAFSSNGRTVYELAHMNIPTIVISHHKREDTHGFASLEKGFINLGVFDINKTSKLIETSFSRLAIDKYYRKLLFLNIKQYNFKDNKKIIVKKILDLL